MDLAFVVVLGHKIRANLLINPLEMYTKFEIAEPWKISSEHNDKKKIMRIFDSHL